MIFSWAPNWDGPERPAGRMAGPGDPNWSEKMNPNDYKDPMRRSPVMKKE